MAYTQASKDLYQQTYTMVTTCKLLFSLNLSGSKYMVSFVKFLSRAKDKFEQVGNFYLYKTIKYTEEESSDKLVTPIKKH